MKATLSLLERVLMKDIVTPVPPEEVRSMIKKSLETAALVNYTRLSSEAKIEGKFFPLLLNRFMFAVTLRNVFTVSKIVTVKSKENRSENDTQLYLNRWY